MPDTSILTPDVGAAPKAYSIKNSVEIVPKAIRAHFDGSGAGSSFLPCLQLVDDAGTIVAEFVAGSTVAAAGSADVTWFPGLGGGGGGRGGGGVTGQAQVRVPVITPDSSGYAYPSLTNVLGFSNVRLILPYFEASQDSSFAGSIPVPQNYSNTPQIILSSVANATSGAARLRVSTAVVQAGSSEDAAWTDEPYQNITVPGTALARFDTTYTLSTAPTAGASLNVKVTRNGSNAADTLAVSLGLWEVLFQFNVT